MGLQQVRSHFGQMGSQFQLAKSEGNPLRFGQHAKKVLADCAELCEAAGLPPLSLIVVFFSALAMIDKHGILMSPSSRDKALTACANFVRSHALDDPQAMQSMIYDFERRAAAGDFDCVTPLDLLKESASRSNRAIKAGLSTVDVDLDALLSAIGTKIPSDDLKDEEQPLGPPKLNPKYAVVIEGPGFRHDGNKYETFETAQRVVRRLECEIRGEEIVLEPNAKPFGVSHPPGWRSATRIYIEEL